MKVLFKILQWAPSIEECCFVCTISSNPVGGNPKRIDGALRLCLNSALLEVENLLAGILWYSVVFWVLAYCLSSSPGKTSVLEIVLIPRYVLYNYRCSPLVHLWLSIFALQFSKSKPQTLHALNHASNWILIISCRHLAGLLCFLIIRTLQLPTHLCRPHWPQP